MFRFNAFIIVTLVIAAALCAIADPPEPPAGKHWERVPVLSDEFDSWDGNKWQKSLWNYTEPNEMVASQSWVADGKLTIRASLGSGSRWFKTCRIMSNAQISYPMYTECAMKASYISAYNTFWMNNGDINDRNEIDMCENNANPTNNKPLMPYTNQSQIFHVVGGDEFRTPNHFDNRNLPDGNFGKGKKWHEIYHMIAVYWVDARNFHFYLNDVYAGKCVSSRDFTRKLNIYFDQWTNSWDGYATQSSLQDNSINTMYVDWVRTWKLETSTPIENNIDPPDAFQGMSGEGKVEICDIRGRVITTIPFNNSETTVVQQLVQTRAGRLGTGLYFYRYVVGNNVIVNKRVKLF